MPNNPTSINNRHRGSTMEAQSVWFPAERKVEIRREQLPEIGSTEVLAESIASGISHGTEMTIFRGQAPDVRTFIDLPQDLIQPQATMGGSFEQRFPIKYAYANVGRVLDAGTDSGLRRGDLIFARVPHQSHFVVDRSLTTKLPDDLSPVDAATTIGLLDVAVNAMLDHPVLVGDVVVVFGLGLVGLFTLQLARRTASTVIAVDPIAHRRDLALRYGADLAVGPEAALEAVRDLSGGRGADVSIEASGAPAALQSAIEATGAEGTIVVPAYYGRKPVELVLSPEFHMRRLRMVSSSVNAPDGRLSARWTNERRLNLDVSLLNELHAGDLISHRIPFDEAERAFALVDEHPDEVLSVVLTHEA
jgi:threonine dehydrogenase-like Zn-dependent dehydrogenase